MEVRTEQLEVRFGATRALEPMDLVFAPGSRALIVGRAHAGKTTLLKALAGLVRPTGGAVYWDQARVAALSADARRAGQAAFGMVFQGDALFDSDPVLQNVLMPLTGRRVEAREALARATEALTQVGLGHALAQRPEDLSGGMRKRVGIARAVVARPQVLLADDPFAGLDPETSLEVAQVLKVASAGRTLLVAASDPPPWLELPRWIFLDQGTVAYDGPPSRRLLEELENAPL